LGSKPQWPEIEYDGFEPGDCLANRYNSTIFRVNRFCEKPPLNEARKLMHQGGLWNTFVAIGRAGAFLNLLAATVMPTMTRIADAVKHRNLGSVYGEIDSIDFSKDVLTNQSHNLLVMQDSASGWADLGHPERVIATLDRHRIEPDWLCEIRRTNPPHLNSLISSPHPTMPALRSLVTVQ
jgi:mannose-1-phosphate guanylyltransferase